MTNWTKPRKNPVTDQQILDTYAELRSGGKTAKALGINEKTVYGVLARNQIVTDGLSRYRASASAHTDEVAREMRAMYEQGVLMKDVLAKFGGNYSAAKSAIKRVGGVLRTNPRPTEKVGESDAVTKLYAQGYSQAAIAQQTGRSQAFVSRMLRLSGVETRGLPSGPEHPNWNGGEYVTGEGYVRVKALADDSLAVAMQDRTGYVLKHRLTMARHLGRALLPSETVHHIDGNSLNNAIENLQLRQGRHGKHAAHKCGDCGSTNVVPVRLVEPPLEL